MNSCFVVLCCMVMNGDESNSIVFCCIVWYGMPLVWYGIEWYGIVWSGMVWYGMEVSEETIKHNHYHKMKTNLSKHIRF